MKKILSILLLALAFPALGQRVTLTVTVTNRAVTTNSLTIGSSFRYFTNAQSSATFATNLTSINATKTNVFNQIAAFPYTAITLQDVGTNSFRLVSSASSLASALAGGWGYVTTNSTVGPSNSVPMVYPFSTILGTTNQTNQGSAIVDGLSNYTTNSVITNAISLGNYLTKGASTQQVVIAPVQFNAALRASPVAFTNGFTSALTNINPVTSNLVNYGNAIRSEGPGGNSFQVGSNAQALGTRSVAIGNGATATNTDSIAIGTSAGATNTSAIAIGNGTYASGVQSVAIGSGGSYALGDGALAIGGNATAYTNAIAIGGEAVATGAASVALGSDAISPLYNTLAIGASTRPEALGSIAIGAGATSLYSNSAAIGPRDHAGNAVATTDTNQIRLGTANHHVSIPGQLLVSGTQSNTTFRGTNIAGGAWAYPRFDLTTLAAGNNLAVPVGTNRFIRFGAGPASAATIVGMVGGATSGGLDGQDVVAFNDTGYTLTFAVNSVDPVPANRINTPSGSDVSIIDQGWASFIYDATDARWKLTGTYPTTATATNAVATGDGGATNLTVYGNAKPPLRIWPQTGSVSNSFEILTTNGAVSAWAGTNGTMTASNMAVTPFASEVGLPYRLFIVTNSVVVTNASTETAMLSNLLGTATIPANWWTPGKSIQLSIRGRYFSGATAVVTNWVKLGSTMIATNMAQVVANVSGDMWNHDLTITCRSIGAAGSIYCQGMTTIPNTAGGTTGIGRSIRIVGGLAGTVDTTAAQTLAFNIHPGATAQAFYIESAVALVIP